MKLDYFSFFSKIIYSRHKRPHQYSVGWTSVYYIYSAWFPFSLYSYSYCFLTSPCECFQFKYTYDHQISNKMPFKLTLMSNFTIPVLSSHLAIPPGWRLLSATLTVHITPHVTVYIFFLISSHFLFVSCDLWPVTCDLRLSPAMFNVRLFTHS